MISKVETWTPPTDEHLEMKSFMLSQLRTSLGDQDYYQERIRELQEKSPVHIYDTDLQSARRSVIYSQQEIKKENDRCESRTRWIRALRESLE